MIRRLERVLWRYLPAALLLVALADLALHFYQRQRAPSFDDYARLGDAVKRMVTPAELVVMAPHWAEPMLRRAVGDDFMAVREIARPDLDTYDYALEVSMLGQRDPQLKQWTELERQQHGPFLLRRLRHPQPASSRWDFGGRLVRASVSTAGASCPRIHTAARAGGLGGHPTFPSDRFQCPGGALFNVSLTVIADERFRPRQCIWAHPPRSGELRIGYHGVALGDAIVGHGGMYWIVERERAGSPVKLVVRVNGEAIGEYVHADGDGWSRFEMPLGKHAGDNSADVEFAVSSPDYKHRHFCFEARSQ